MDNGTRRLARSLAATALAVGTLGSLLSVGAFGCHATVKERHFLTTPERQGVEPNYYRVTIRGRAIASQARYVSGFFDEAAVEEYFGEFSQPDNGQFPAKSGDAAKDEEDKPIDERLSNRSLVMLLSANSDAVAGQIGAIAESQEVMAAISGLVGKDAADEIAAKAEALRTFEAGTDALVTEADELLAADTSKEDVMALANRLAGLLGAPSRFDDPARILEWIDSQQAATEVNP